MKDYVLFSSQGRPVSIVNLSPPFRPRITIRVRRGIAGPQWCFYGKHPWGGRDYDLGSVRRHSVADALRHYAVLLAPLKRDL
ncbi:MAG: hypothetical protein ACM34G_17270 [Acidobacteriota bacterium]